MLYCLLLVLFFHICMLSANVTQLDLGLNRWRVEGKHYDSGHFIKFDDVQIPGCIHTDYMSTFKKENEQAYYRFNDDKYQWIAKSNWSYITDFHFKSLKLFEEKETWLVFKGLDTFSSIYFNGLKVGESENMFVEYKFNITNILQLYNRLEVKFISALHTANETYSHLKYDIPPDSPPKVQHGFSHVNLIRKEQSSFSWDWGPAFATQGIWKPVYLQLYSESILDSVSAEFKMESEEILISIVVRKTSLKSLEDQMTHLKVDISDLGISKSFSDLSFSLFNKSDSISYMAQVRISLKNVTYSLWWPNGHGSQTLYNIAVEYTCNNETSSKSIRFGLREVKLIQEKINESTNGTTFYFRVNGKDIFVKGSNWVPSDAFHTRITPKKYERLLESARLANMNMLRVWGGGVYEDDHFYSLCDEKGIMVWQDFMFACAMYPADNKFLQNVKTEVIENVMRLKHHPSIALWAGNNENEAALAKNWYSTNKDKQLYEKDYKMLYTETIKQVVKELDKERPFVTSSPTNGVVSDMSGGISGNPYDGHFGDVHYYNYVDDCLDWNKYPNTRFASEFGFESWPSLDSLRKVSRPSEDWVVDSDWAIHRQHHENATQQISDQINRNFKLDLNNPNKTFEFISTVYFSQIMQALCVQSQTEFYMKNRNELDSNGLGLTMGALYWQFNDVWQAPTWSSIDYSVTWKPLHYFARKFFSPIALIAFCSGDEVVLYAHSSLSHDVVDVTLVVRLHKWAGFRHKQELHPISKISASSSKRVFSAKLAELVSSWEDCDDKSCFVSFEVENRSDIATKYFFPTRFKNLYNLKNPSIQIEYVEKVNDLQFNIVLKASYPALFVWIELHNFEGYFSDNAFLMTSQNKNISLFLWSPHNGINSTTILESVSLSSVFDYQNLKTSLWIEDITAKLIFSVIGVIFIIISAVQVILIVVRLNIRKGQLKPKNSNLLENENKQPDLNEVDRRRMARKRRISSSSTQDDSTAFVIRSKRGYGHKAKNTEYRFYIV